MIKVRKIAINEHVWNNYIPSVVKREYEVIEMAGLNEVMNVVKSLDPYVKKLLPGQKVFFYDRVMFPRRKFQKKFRENKMVNSPEKADVVIIDKGILGRDFSYFSNQEYYPLKTLGLYSINANDVDRDKSLPTFKGTSHYYGISTSLVKRANDVLLMKGKPIMDVKYLNLTSEERIDVEAYEKLTRMLTSNDILMKNMALNLITAYDYKKDKTRIAMLLGSNWMGVGGYIKKNVEVASLLRKLEIDFPGWQYSSNYGNEFWLKAAIESPDDEIVMRAFNIWMKKQWAKAPDVKLVKI